MVKRLAAVIVLGASLAACTGGRDATAPRGSSAPAPILTADRASGIPDRYIVVFRDNVGDVAATAQRLNGAHGGVLRHTYRAALHGFAAEFTPAQVEALRSEPEVAFIEQDQVARIVDTQANPPSWGIDRIDQRNLPLDNSYTYPTGGGAGVHVYIIDTGIRTTHTQFGGRATFDVNTNSDGIMSDCNGHGTHVSGTVGGSTYGVAKGVRLHAVRVLNCSGSGSFSDVIAGVDWVTTNHQSPAVANMSLGGSASTALDLAVSNSIASGVTYAIAAGNDNLNACNQSPARVATAITVGATTIGDVRASFSNFGTCLDIFAPGVNILSSWNGSDTDTLTISGTSMATPHVAGAAALYLASNLTATPAQVASALTTNATSGKVTSPGTGSPNLLLYTGFIGTGGNQAPVARFTFSCTGLTCTFNGTGSTDDGGIVSYAWTFGDASTGTGPNLSHTYGAAGTYSVGLTVTDNGVPALADDTTQAVTVTTTNNGPTARFTFTCTALTCSFDGTTSTAPNGFGGGALWTFGDGTSVSGVGKPTKTYAVAGTYNVTFRITDRLGFADDTTQAVTVTSPNARPVARFAFNCTGLTCTFNGTGSTDDASIVSYAWTFGDATTGTGSSVSHTYAAAGTFSVRLTVTDNGIPALADDTTQTVTVATTNNGPTARFTFTCTSLTCTFDGTTSTAPNGFGGGALWTFGDGTSVSGVGRPTKTYAAAGSYSVTFRITDRLGFADDTTRVVTVP